MMFSASYVFGQSVTVNGKGANTISNSAAIDSLKNYYSGGVLYLYSGFPNAEDDSTTKHKGAITSTGALTIDVGTADISIDSTVVVGGALTIRGTGTLRLKTTVDTFALSSTGALTIDPGVTVEATSDSAAVNAGGAVVIGGTLKTKSDGNPKLAIISTGGVSTQWSGTLEGLGGDSVSISAKGAIDFSSATAVNRLDSVVTTTGNIILGENVTLATSHSSFATGNGAITYGARANNRLRALTATGAITVNSPIGFYADSIKSSGGAVVTTAKIDSVKTISGTTLSLGAVVADSISATGSISIGGTTRARIITSPAGPITINGLTTARSSTPATKPEGIVSTSGDITISGSGVDTAAVIYGRTITTSAYVRADSVYATNTLSIGGTTQARLLEAAVGPLGITGTTNVIGTSGRSGIRTPGAITLDANSVTVKSTTDTAAIIGGSVSILKGLVTTEAKKLSLAGLLPPDSTIGILSTGAITVATGARVSGHGVVGTGGSTITWNGIADTLNIIETIGTGSITIGSTAKLNYRSDDSLGVNLVTNSGRIELLNTTAAIVRGIYSNTGAIVIDGAVTASDSIATGGALSISKNVTVTGNAGTKESAIHARTIDITGGAITANSKGTAQYGLYADGNISISSPATIVSVDSIHSANGGITLSNTIGSQDTTITGLVAKNGTITISSSGGGLVGDVTGGNVVISGNIKADTVVVPENNSLSISGTLASTKSVHLGGALNVLFGGKLNLLDSTKLVASSINLAGAVTGAAADSVYTEGRGDITITGGSITAGKIGTTGTLTVSAGGQLTLNPAGTDQPTAGQLITPKNGLYITGGSVVRTYSTGRGVDVDSTATVSVKNFGQLIRDDGTPIFMGESKLLSDVDGSAVVRLQPGYPRLTPGTTPAVSFANNAITISLLTDSVSYGNIIGAWINTDAAGFTSYGGQYYPNDTSSIPATKHLGEQSSVTATPAELYGNEIAITTERGVLHISFTNPRPDATTDRDGAIIGQPASASWAESNSWPTEVDVEFSTAVYSNETITVKFTFAKNATKNETILFRPTSSNKSAIMDFLTPSTDILEAGKKEVTVVFTFKKEVNNELRRAILTRTSKIGAQEIIASIKDDANGEFGTATSASIDLYDAVTVSPTYVASTIGYEGTVDLGIAGGTGAEQVRVLDANGDVVVAWTPASTFTADLTPARLAKIFEAGATLQVKAPNTFDRITITNIAGPNTIGSGGGNSTPDATHRIRLEYDAQLQTPTGVYPSTNQSFTFKVARPEGELNDLVVTVEGISETGTYFTSTAIPTLYENANNDGWSVSVTNITTDIRITISFRASTGVNNIVSTSVWSVGKSITISSASRGVAKVYSLVGTLVSEFTYNEGTTSIALPVGTYVVVLSDGTRSKLVIR
jgi:hypothetical protein